MKTSNFPADDSYAGIYFFNETDASLPVDASGAKRMALLVENSEKCQFSLVEIVFVDEEEIVRVNREHLERTYVTDIISFRYDQDNSNQQIEGTLYCCAPRIKEQAEEYSEPAEKEFRRIIIHGLLHLVGYEDTSESTRKEMREREDFYLEKLA